jgi:hypothetical protein
MRSILSSVLLVLAWSASVFSTETCRFAKNYQCSDFSDSSKVDEYLALVATWEGHFAQPSVGYDLASGYSYDGHPLDYQTGGLYGEPHLFSAPSKESIHVGLLALAVDGNDKALIFAGGMEGALKILETKINGYEQFNATYPGFGCFTVCSPLISLAPIVPYYLFILLFFSLPNLF